MAPTYVLAANPEYGWFTGSSVDGRQALMGLDINAEICVLFEAGGKMVDVVERCFDRDGNPVSSPITNWPFHLTKHRETLVNERFARWLDDTIVKHQPIVIQEFYVEDRFIQIEPMPEDYIDFIEDPESADERSRTELPELIDSWRNSRLYVFWWNEDYWMNPDGTVNTH